MPDGKRKRRFSPNIAKRKYYANHSMTVKTGKYRIVLLDKDGFDIGEREADNLVQAKDEAEYLLSDRYADVCESTHADLGTAKAEVRLAKDGTIVKEYWYSNTQD